MNNSNNTTNNNSDEIIIKQCDYNDILNLRRDVMYPEKDLDYVKVDGDQDIASGNTIHLGLFLNRDEKPISIISLFINKEKGELQFRKFATQLKYQNKGYGSKLLEHVLNYSKSLLFIKRIWCNARLEKSNFYINKFNFKKTNQTYIKDGREFIILEKFI